jgi:integrase
LGTLERDVAVLKYDRDKASGLGDGIGWHTFRHTYRTLRDETGAPLSVQQRLMRHADARMTLKCGVALDDSKRNANKKVVRLVLVGKKAAP